MIYIRWDAQKFWANIICGGEEKAWLVWELHHLLVQEIDDITVLLIYNSLQKCKLKPVIHCFLVDQHGLQNITILFNSNESLFTEWFYWWMIN